MSAGELSPGEIEGLKRAIRDAEDASGLTFSLYLGAAEGDPREYARSLHAQLSDPDESVLVLCDPVSRALEIVTGSVAKRRVSDDQANLAAVSMTSSFEAGRILGGLEGGIRQLGEGARTPPKLHEYTGNN